MGAAIRLSAFIGVFLIMAGLEYMYPRRRLSHSKSKRWFSNLSLTVVDTFLVQLTVGAIVISTAFFAKEHGWGILYLFELPVFLSTTIGILFLDFIIYIQHVLFHYLPFFWRFHKVHHTDLDFDVSTGIRFHPGEIFFSLVIKMGAVVVIGASPQAVLIFEIILNVSSLFNHSNVNLKGDRWLRYVVVTPDVHRVHHSTVSAEMNSNFAFSITWWDRLFGTYRAFPNLSHDKMEIGLADFKIQNLGLGQLLKMPFVGMRS